MKESSSASMEIYAESVDDLIILSDFIIEGRVIVYEPVYRVSNKKG